MMFGKVNRNVVNSKNERENCIGKRKNLKTVCKQTRKNRETAKYRFSGLNKHSLKKIIRFQFEMKKL